MRKLQKLGDIQKVMSSPAPADVAANEPVTRVTIRMSAAVSDLLKREAALVFRGVGITRIQFLRLLVRRLTGSTDFERGERAPVRDPLPMRKDSLQTLTVEFSEPELAILDEVCNRAATMSRSVVLTLLVLDWCEIGPFVLARPTPASAAGEPSMIDPASLQTSQASYHLTLRLPAPIMSMLSLEAQRFWGDRGRARVLRMLLGRAAPGSRAGISSRGAAAPRIELPRGDVVYELEKLGLVLTPEHTSALDSLRFIAGSIRRSALVTLLVLDWFDGGPFWLDRELIERAQ